MWRIRSPPCCPGPMTRPRWSTCGWPTYPWPSLVTMVAETLHVDRDAATGLVGAIQRQTSGNPYETVELLNALRRDGLLTTTASGWRWDDAAIRRHLDQTEAAGLPAASIDALPVASRELVEAMACLGGRTELSVLQTASGEPAGVVEERLAPALDDGLLVVEPGRRQAVRFRHDRIHETVVTRLAATAATQRPVGDGAAARRRAGALRRRGGAVPARGRRARRRDGAATGGGPAAQRGRPGRADRRQPAGGRAAGSSPAADRPG